ncbi:uncharacterized protein BDV14DRAFT_173546 [Aspergillus stella-maris]|uniref:uncharacterized protein n=1 Tax=Aspergillus stella-maris TaxID=1810926 RepID=UPI003CCDC133
MPELLSLPTETLRDIFHHADQPTRKALRLGNRHLAQIGQESVFKTIHIGASQESYDKIDEIIKRPDLTQLITKVYLNTFNTTDFETFDDDENDDGEMGEMLFSYVKKLPRVQSVVLRFHPEVEEDEWDEAPQGMDFRSCVMEQSLEALVDMPSVKELAIRDLQNVNEKDPKTIMDLKKVLGRLKALRLNVANVSRGMSGSSDYHRENPQTFFSEFPSTWLKPCLANLEHLTLYSTLYVGFFPKCDLRHLHFPRLKTLALGNHTFIDDSQLTWILSHASTLSELYLDDCAIVWEAAIYGDYELGGDTYKRTLIPKESFKPHAHLPERKLYYSYPSRWADYFRAFKEKLVNLRHFRYGHGIDWWTDECTPFETETRIPIGFHEESYMVFNDGLLPSEYMQYIHWEVPDESVERGIRYEDGQVLEPSEEDRRALVELCESLGQKVDLEREEDY